MLLFLWVGKILVLNKLFGFQLVVIGFGLVGFAIIGRSILIVSISSKYCVNNFALKNHRFCSVYAHLNYLIISIRGKSFVP